MRNIEFVPKAFEEFRYWVENDKKIAGRIGDLIRDINRDPFSGIGKPEPLKRNYAGFWSRRINDEHRIIYKINNSSIIIFSCFAHYKDK